jgi:serine/threonine protein kinase
MELRGAHAGKFTPKCPQCKHRFMLLVPEDPNIPPLVGEMPGQRPSAEAVAGESHAGLTAVGVNAISATALPAASSASAKPQAAVARTNVNATVAPNIAAPPAASTTRASVTMPPGNGSPRANPANPGATMPKGTVPPVGLSGPRGDMPARTLAEAAAEDAHVIVEGPELSGNLGGYEIVKKLGEGGMGQVYLARQVSLDRPVALKVLSPQLAEDPQFVARFTREAYAAAQLSHHNVVQIHDIGVDQDTNYFSMEFVEGQTLDRLVKHDGKLDPEVAVGYVLQAARGLRFAHDHGLVHRDVKPDNLLLNVQGIVKVADLGLVKQAGNSDLTMNAAKEIAAKEGAKAKGAKEKNMVAEATMPAAPQKTSPEHTQFNISMGTPAYMPPEQARDAAHVDQRADIYSLGCTLYDLLTGQPPFMGKTAVEVITKHQTAPVVPPDRMARHVSPELSSVVMKMMAKRPEERYQTMAEVVQALENILGVDSGRPFSPQEEHVDVLETVVADFNGSKRALMRRNLVIGFLGGCAALAIACPLIWGAAGGWYSGAVIGFVALTCVLYQAILGVTRKTHLFTRVRQYVFGARWTDYVKVLAGLAILVMLLVAFNLHWVWLGAAIVALVVAIAFHATVDRMVARERAGTVDKLEGMLKTMRLRGLDEAALRQFVCKYSGERWEELYETLFGYEAKRSARRSWGKSERGRDRKRYSAWRDVIIDAIDRREALRKEARERRMLARIEAKALEAKGLDLASANRKAKQAAERLVDKAAKVKQSAELRKMMTVLPTTSGRTMMFAGAKPLASWADGFEEAESKDKKRKGRDGGEREHEGYFKRRFGTPLDFLLGPQIRVLAGAILIAFFALWVHQNGGVRFSVSKHLDAERVAKEGVTAIKDAANTADIGIGSGTGRTKTLQIPMVPDNVLDVVGSNCNGGIAGAMLLLSGFFSGRRLAAMIFAGAAITLFAYRFDAPLLVDRPWVAAGIGVLVALGGIFMFRKTPADG